MNTKTLKLCALGIAFSGAVATDAMAATFPLFSISENLSGTANIIDANKMVGAYNETTTITSFNPITGAGTFTTSLLWRLGQMQNVDTGFTWGSFGSDQPLTQAIWGRIQAQGTLSQSGGVTTFKFTPGAGLGFEFWYDTNNNTTFTPLSTSQPANGSAFYTPAGGSLDDQLLATGAVMAGNGSQSCTGSQNCGSYGVTTSVVLTAIGLNYFVDPKPFYEVAFSTGQFNGVGIAEGATTRLNGSQDITFVPEPASLALLGIGALGMARRRVK